MRFFIISEFYPPLAPWLFEDKSPIGMPAVYNLFQYLGNSDEHQFYGVIMNRVQSRVIDFPNGSRIELIKFSAPFYYLWKFLVFFKLLFLGRKILKKENYDVVYGLSTFTTVASILGKWNKVFSVGRIYGTILTDPLKRKQYFKIYTRFIFDVLAIKQSADLFLCTFDGSQFDKVVHFFSPKAKIDLLFNGIEKELKERLLETPLVGQIEEKGEIKMCYVARLYSYKRQFLAIEMMEELVFKMGVENISLNILGTGAEEEKLKEMVKVKKLDGKVTFIPEIPHQQIPDFVAKHTMSLFFYEGGSLGNIIWESAFAGRLICTVDNGATGEIFKDEINCLMAADTDDFPKVMAQKIKDKIGEDVSKITAEGRRNVAAIILNWEDRFEKEMQLIAERKRKLYSE